MNLAMRNRTKPTLLALLVALGSTLTIAQPIEPIDHEHQPAERLGAPDELGQISQALKDQLSATFLTDEERAELRVDHGVWTDEDLENPIYAAKAAFAVGNYNHPSLSDPNANPFDRAQGALMRGEPQQAINYLDERLGGLQPPSYLSIRAQSYEMLGQTDQAIKALEELESLMTTDIVSRADELAYGVEGLIQLTRLRGPQADAKSEYQNLAKLLANARDNIDRLSWRVRLVEAQLLYTHNNYKDAYSAAVETLRLHPRNAQAASIIANMAIDSFDFDAAEEIASKLDLIADGRAIGDTEKAPPPTLHSAIIHARIALRRKDPEGAERSLDRLLSVMPNQRDLLELNAAAAAAGFRMSSTGRLLDQYDELSPNSPFAMMRVAQTLAEYRQYTYAAEVFRRIIERAPFWAQPRLDLGLLLVQAGHDAHAKSTLEDALALDPFDIRAQNSLTLVTELASYQTIETDHFIIRFKPGTTDGILANEMPDILERIHARVASDLPGGVDHEPKVKTIIELMPNHEWFAVRIGGMPSIHTMAASTGPVIAIEAPREGKKSSVGHYDWARVLQHEYTHTVNLSRTRNRVIHWMTEANAVFNEDSPRASQTWSLLTKAYENNTLFDLDEINTAFVRPKKPTDRSQAYAQGAWMFEYIVERYGKETPLAIYDASAAGRSAADAFEQVLSTNPQSFLEEFRTWAHDELLSRGLILADGIPDLNEIFSTEKQDPENDEDRSPPSIPTIAEINKLLEQYPDHPQLITLRVGIALVGSDTRLSPELVGMLEHAITIRPTDESPHQHLAKHYLAGETYEEQAKAIPFLEYLDAREIHSPAFAGELSLLYAQSSNLDHSQLAMSKALRAISIAPFDADQRERAARVALLTGNTNEAVHQLEALIQLEPDRAIHQRRLDALNQRLGQSSAQD
jgi:tetratricopeptide (TPR) repeat protein